MAPDNADPFQPPQYVRVGEAGYKSAADVGAPTAAAPAETSTPMTVGDVAPAETPADPEPEAPAEPEAAPVDAEPLVVPDFQPETIAEPAPEMMA